MSFQGKSYRDKYFYVFNSKPLFLSGITKLLFMKKFLASVFVIGLFAQGVVAQDLNIRPRALGISFSLNDYTTPQRLRKGSVGQVLKDKQWAKIKETSPGFAITYIKGLRSHVDFAATLNGAYVNYQIPDKNYTGDAFLLEADASANLKMLSEKHVFTPYLNVGLGVSRYRGYYGAFLPLGVGLKFNLFNEAAIFINSQYRVPVNKEAVAYHFMHSIGIASVLGK